MADEVKVEKTKAEKLKDDARPLVNVVRDFDQPDMMKIPKPNPRCHYRWARNETDNIATLEAQGFRVANSDEVRECGLKPNHVDGGMHRGDLILMLEDWAYYKEKQVKRQALLKRQAEMQQKGTSRKLNAGSYAGHQGTFSETVRGE